MVAVVTHSRSETFLINLTLSYLLILDHQPLSSDPCLLQQPQSMIPWIYAKCINAVRMILQEELAILAWVPEISLISQVIFSLTTSRPICDRRSESKPGPMQSSGSCVRRNQSNPGRLCSGRG